MTPRPRPRPVQHSPSMTNTQRITYVLVVIAVVAAVAALIVMGWFGKTWF
jgi:hypothetical protein